MQYILRFFIIFFVILCVGAFISLFQGGIHLEPQLFWNHLVHLISLLFHPSELTYETTSFINDKQYPVFPYLFEHYGYSLFILAAGFLLAVSAALLLTTLTFFIPMKRRKWLFRAAALLESAPDLFIIVLAQLLFVFIYKKTGILVFQVAGAFERPYLLPLLTYSILPTIFLYRTLLLIFEEELAKPYVELARGKGLNRLLILLNHVLRNGLVSLINHSRMIIAFMISNLVMLEILFNSYGLTWFIINHPTYEIATFCILLIFIPLYFFEGMMQKLKNKAIGGAAE